MSDLIESRISEIREDDAKFVAGVQAGVDAGAYTARGVIIGLLAVITRLRTASAPLDPSSAPSETPETLVQRALKMGLNTRVW